MKTATSINGRDARLVAGFSLQDAAKAVRRSPAYLRECERTQQFPLSLAEKLARVYGCDLNHFRPGAGNRLSTSRATSRTGKRSGVGARRSASTPRGEQLSAGLAR